MADTLRSIVEGMAHTGVCAAGRTANIYACLKCRLLALLDAAEKTDLVEKWRKLGDLQCDNDDTCCHTVCADELRDWLAARGEVSR